MTTARILPLVILVASVVGCAHDRRFTILSERELARCKEVAMDAARSPETWQRLGGRRLTSDPFKFDTARMEYEIDFDTADRVRVIIPSGVQFGWHPCFVAVTVVRREFAVVEIHESCWP